MNKYVNAIYDNKPGEATNFIGDIFSKIDKTYYRLYIGLMAVGILCHGFMLFNKLPNHDDVIAIADKGTTYKLGRWFLEATGIISGMFSIPLFIGIFSISMIIFSAFLVCEVLEIKRVGRIFAIGALMVCFPTVAGTFAFMFTADSYFLALFFSCMGIWLSVKLPVRIKFGGVIINYILSIILLTLALGIYQAYYSVALTLTCLYGMSIFLKYKSGKTIRECIKVFLVLTLSMLAYLIINQIVLAAKEITFSGTTVSEVFSVMPHAVYMSYKNVVSLCCFDLAGLSYGKALRLCWFMTITGTGILFIILAVKKRRNLLLGAGLLLALPICINFMRLFMRSREMDTLIMYAYVLLFVAPVFLLEEFEKMIRQSRSFGIVMKVCRTLLVIGVFVVVWKYIIQINRFYVGMDIVKTEAVSYYTTLITQIKSVEGYQADMKICLYGTKNQDPALTKYNPYTAAIRGGLTAREFASMYSRKSFMARYCGFAAKYLEPEELESAEEILEMPCYPDDGSIRIINDVIVVKFE